MPSSPDALLCTCALSSMEGRTRPEWKGTLQTLGLIDVTFTDLVSMTASDAWKWLGWDASRVRDWQSALDIAQRNLSNIAGSDFEVVTELDDDAPVWLRNLPSVPWVFYRGDLSILAQRTIGFSGQRDAGESSLEITMKLGREAARRDFTVVSGGAKGIDLAAHSTVLEDGGATAVVLPQGLTTWRPPFGLTNSRVLALSEDLPWDGWTTESAMRRNRMIVDLSRIFVVPQSGTSGGSHSTGMYALRQGRVTFVPDLGSGYPGNQKLLQHGAKSLLETDGQYDFDHMLLESTPVKGPAQSSLF